MLFKQTKPFRMNPHNDVDDDEVDEFLYGSTSNAEKNASTSKSKGQETNVTSSSKAGGTSAKGDQPREGWFLYLIQSAINMIPILFILDKKTMIYTSFTMEARPMSKLLHFFVCSRGKHLMPSSEHRKSAHGRPTLQYSYVCYTDFENRQDMDVDQEGNFEQRSNADADAMEDYESEDVSNIYLLGYLRYFADIRNQKDLEIILEPEGNAGSSQGATQYVLHIISGIMKSDVNT